MKKPIFHLLLIALLGCIPAQAGEKPTDRQTRVVCFGDSITKRGYPEILGKNLKVEAINAGVAGHPSSAGLRRMQKDVIDRNPDIVVIFFGTNDARVDEPRVYNSPKQYQENLTEMVDACEKADAKVVICTLPPVDVKKYFERHETGDYDAAGGIPKLWEEYRQAAIKVAKSKDVPLVDLNQELLKEPGWLSPDGVHPSNGGNRIIAGLIGKQVAPLINN